MEIFSVALGRRSAILGKGAKIMSLYFGLLPDGGGGGEGGDIKGSLQKIKGEKSSFHPKGWLGSI